MGLGVCVMHLRFFFNKKYPSFNLCSIFMQQTNIYRGGGNSFLFLLFIFLEQIELYNVGLLDRLSF